jgi:hypothetical protein
MLHLQFEKCSTFHHQSKLTTTHFSIRDEGDINNLDFRDVLLAIGGQMYRQYRQREGKLPKQLLKELNAWRGKIEEQVTTILEGRTSESEIGAGLDAFFANASAKIKLEPTTRRELRQVFERDITGLIKVINDVAASIQAREKRPPLILIDDLDKPSLETAKAIFYEQREIMMQPICPIVYTVSSPLFYSPEFEAIRDRAVFLPNVKLHPQGEAGERDDQGYQTLRMFILKRLHPDLISDEAIQLASQMSGGVFRELARVMRNAMDRTLEDEREYIEIEDVRKAAAEIRGEYRRILTEDQRRVLRKVRRDNCLDDPDKIAPLLQILAVLEYANGEPWCDVHPALGEMLDEIDNHESTT